MTDLRQKGSELEQSLQDTAQWGASGHAELIRQQAAYTALEEQYTLLQNQLEYDAKSLEEINRSKQAQTVEVQFLRNQVRSSRRFMRCSLMCEFSCLNCRAKAMLKGQFCCREK